jgi:hypothetical protein
MILAMFGVRFKAVSKRVKCGNGLNDRDMGWLHAAWPIDQECTVVVIDIPSSLWI